MDNKEQILLSALKALTQLQMTFAANALVCPDKDISKGFQQISTLLAYAATNYIDVPKDKEIDEVIRSSIPMSCHDTLILATMKCVSDLGDQMACKESQREGRHKEADAVAAHLRSLTDFMQKWYVEYDAIGDTIRKKYCK